MKTKELIVKTALKLFLQKGYYNMSMAKIAAEIRISKPAIYYHFKDKDAMVHGVLDYFTTKMKIWSLHYFADLESGQDFLERMFQAIPIFQNIEQVLLDETTEKYSYSYNDLLTIISKNKPEFRLRISQDLINTRQLLEHNIRRAQDEHIIRPDLRSSQLAIMIQTILEGSGFISELDPSLKTDVLSIEMYQILWRLIKR